MCNPYDNITNVHDKINTVASNAFIEFELTSIEKYLSFLGVSSGE